MRSLISIALLLVSCLPAWAESVLVRSGEHETFTRLVFYLPEATDYTIDTRNREVEIIPSRPMTFDVSTVFDRIRKQDITAVDNVDGRGSVIVTLNCECRTRTDRLLGGALVLDVFRPEKTAPGGPATQPIIPVTANDQVPRPPRDYPHLQNMLSELNFPNGASTEDMRASVPQQIADQFDDILPDIARLSSEGILTLEPRAKQPDMGASESSGETSAEATTQSEDTLAADPVALVCKPNSAFDISSWSGEAPFYRTLGGYRLAVFDETDHLDMAEAVGMAKFYISYGFGAEALSILDMLDSGNGLDVFRAMAIIVDGRPFDRAPVFSDAETCSQAEIMWAVLATTDHTVAKRADKPTLFAALNALPAPVNSLLGEQLANKLLAAQELDAANAVLRILDRIEDKPTTGRKLIEGKMALKTGERDQGQEVLEEIVPDDGESSALALIELVLSASDTGSPVASDTAETLATYRFQFRDTDREQDLTRAEAIARASIGDFVSAFDLLDQSSDDMAGQAISGRDAFNRMTRYLVDEADDESFLKIAFNILSEQGANLLPDLQLQVADRLLSLGFSDIIGAFLPDGSRAAATLDGQVILARASLRSGSREIDEAALNNLDNRDIDMELARHMSDQGQYARASTYFERAGAMEEKQRQLWLAGDWDQLSESEDEVLRQSAILMTEPETELDMTSDGFLTRSRELLTNSTDSRAFIETMLERFPTPRLPEP